MRFGGPFTRRRLARGAAAASVVTGVVVAVVVVVAPGSTPKSTTPKVSIIATQDQIDASRARLTACLKRNGIDLTKAGSGASLTTAQRTKLNALVAKPCHTDFEDSLKVTKPQFTDWVADSRKFFACINQHGVKVPNPTDADALTQIGKLNTKDPKLQAAANACLHILPRELGGTGANVE